MAEEKFSDNLLRMIAAELHFSNCLAVSQHLLGKPYLALSPVERGLVDRAVMENVAPNYQNITPKLLSHQEAPQPMGFVTPASGKSGG